MSDDTKRDAAADLAVCTAATPGPWGLVIVSDEYDGGPEYWVGMGKRHPVTQAHGQYAEDSTFLSQANAVFIAAARTALPHWIERATAAEAEVERLRAMLGKAMGYPKLGDGVDTGDHTAETLSYEFVRDVERLLSALAVVLPDIGDCQQTAHDVALMLEAKGGTA